MNELALSHRKTFRNKLDPSNTVFIIALNCKPKITFTYMVCCVIINMHHIYDAYLHPDVKILIVHLVPEINVYFQFHSIHL